MALKQAEELKATDEELSLIQNKLKTDPKFREEFAEYAKNLADPTFKEQQEAELRVLEKQQGGDGNFQIVAPHDGFCIKALDGNGDKVFLNICHNAKIEPISRNTSAPQGSQETGSQGSGGHFSVPYSLSECPDTSDKSGKKCRAFDLVFNSDAVKQAENSNDYFMLISQTAQEAVEATMATKLSNLKKMKIKRMGVPLATTIREAKSAPSTPKSKPSAPSKTPKTPKTPKADKPVPNLQKEHTPVHSEEKSTPLTTPSGHRAPKSTFVKASAAEAAKEAEPTFDDPLAHLEKDEDGMPKLPFHFIHSQELDISQYIANPMVRGRSLPKDLILVTTLPSIPGVTTKDVDVEANEDNVTVRYGPCRLYAAWPFTVVSEMLSAKITKKGSELRLTAPVDSDVYIKKMREQESDLNAQREVQLEEDKAKEHEQFEKEQAERSKLLEAEAKKREEEAANAEEREVERRQKLEEEQRQRSIQMEAERCEREETLRQEKAKIDAMRNHVVDPVSETGDKADRPIALPIGDGNMEVPALGPPSISIEEAEGIVFTNTLIYELEVE